MQTSNSKKQEIPPKDFKKIEIKLQKVKNLHMKINQLKIKIREHQDNRKEGNPEDILKNM